MPLHFSRGISDAILPMKTSDGTRQFSLSDEQFQDLARELENYRRFTASPIVCLIDASGLLIAKAGKAKDRALVLLAALGAANFSSSAQMAKLLGEGGGFKAQSYEGSRYTIYFYGVGTEHILISVYTRNSPLSVIQHFAMRFEPKLYNILNRAVDSEKFKIRDGIIKEKLSKKEFENELSSKLDSVLQRQ